MARERQTEFDRASAAEVARAAQEVQYVAEQQRTAQLTALVAEAAAQTQVNCCRVMLCCAVLCCAVLCCAVLCSLPHFARFNAVQACAGF